MMISMKILVLITIYVCTATNAQNSFQLNSDLVNAVKSGNDASVRQLIANGANVNFKDGDGNIPLHHAAANGHENVVNVLIQHGSDVNLKNTKDGSIPLHLAAWRGHTNVMDILTKAGTNVNLQNFFGDTALHLLALRGHDNAAFNILLANGADVHIRSTAGKEPRDYALARGHQRIVDLLDSIAVNNKPTNFQPNSNPNPTKSKGAVAIELACTKYASKNPSDFIVGPSEEAKPEEFPWIAALGYFNEQTNSIDYRCAATIISEQFVITAAHCIPEKRPVIVRMGRINLNDRDANNYYIQEIIRHNGFTHRFKKDDIALIRLTQNIRFTRDIRPACLETDPSDLSPEASLQIIGWGSTAAERTNLSDVLLKATVATVPLSECNRNFTEFNRIPNLSTFRMGITEGQYCAYSKFGSDTCQGDSGGPLQFFRTQYTAHVVGIVSFGLSCGTTYPGIYTRIAHYSDWIASHVWPNGFISNSDTI